MMIKFWKEDFRYIRRYSDYPGYTYVFQVRGESANYLINHYDLPEDDIEVVVDFNPIIIKFEVLITDFPKHSKRVMTKIKEEDYKEIRETLFPYILDDLRSYEEYLSDTEWNHRDERWLS